jgi:hypothetical protein
MRMRPNTSLKQRANVMPHGPVLQYAVDFHRPEPGDLPSSTA